MRLFLITVAMGLMAQSVPAQAAPDDALVYEVKRGDTLINLGTKYFVQAGDYRALQKANNIRNDRAIPVGSKLQIYVVHSRTISTSKTRRSAMRGDINWICCYVHWPHVGRIRATVRCLIVLV